MDDLKNRILSEYAKSEDKSNFVHDLRNFLHGISLNKEQPVDNVMWVDINLVEPNDYNPNSVAKIEMKLLYISIDHDGYTQPVVTIFDEEKGKYVIVDGFHRYFVMKTNKDIRDKCSGKLPIVVLNKSINDRMSSTVRHNRARGKHSVSGMSKMVFSMLENGWEDSQICNELGMEPEELLKLKHVTGFSKLFENIEYRKAWQTNKQIAIKEAYAKEHPGEREKFN